MKYLEERIVKIWLGIRASLGGGILVTTLLIVLILSFGGRFIMNHFSKNKI